MAATDVFAALGNPVRRRILELLLQGPSTVNEIVAHFRLQRPAVSEHLQVLRNAKLVRDKRSGRERRYHVESESLAEVQEWLKPFELYWRKRLRRLEQTVKALEQLRATFTSGWPRGDFRPGVSTCGPHHVVSPSAGNSWDCRPAD